MKNRERFKKIMNFEPVDRLPFTEWAGWWDKTITRWKSEGLPENLTDDLEIRAFFGFDTFRQCWIEPRKKSIPENQQNYKSLAADVDEYENLKMHLFPEDAFDKKQIQSWVEEHENGDSVIWLTLEGHYWFPRTLFGMEEINYAFYEKPELVHKMNEDQLNFNLRVLDEFCAICKPDFMTFAEDMSFNKGPMLSKRTFDEFIAPYYKRILPKVKEYGIIPFVDTDGNPEELIPWFLEIGMEGMLPMERQAGTDLNRIRQNHPKLNIIGGFDKTVMCKGKDAMIEEFERLLPVMKSGGYQIGVDHQTPPDVSLENYYIFLELFKTYMVKAIQ
jgi:hypothetical protein